MTNEKDIGNAYKIVAEWKQRIGQTVKYEQMEADIAAALAAARKEEREAAFREAVGIVHNLAATTSTSKLISVLEAAATE